MRGKSKMENTLSVVIECNECGKSFKADAENVKTMRVKSDDKEFKLVYVDCENCNKRHFVQIDDDETEKLKIRNLVMFKKLSTKKLAGKKVTKTENRIFKELREKLSDLRVGLMKEYEGQVVTDTLTGELVTLHFTFC